MPRWVEYSGEVASDEQAARSGFEFPHAIDRVEVGVERIDGAGALIEREELLSLDCVRVGAGVLDIAIVREGCTTGDPIEFELGLDEDDLAVGADEERISERFQRLHIAAERTLPVALTSRGERPRRVAVAIVAQRAGRASKDRLSIGAQAEREHAICELVGGVPITVGRTVARLKADEVAVALAVGRPEVAAHIEVVVEQLEVEDGATNRCVERLVVGAGHRVESGEIRHVRATDVVEAATHIHAGAVDGDRLDQRIGIGVEGRVDDSGEGVDLRNAVAEHSVDGAEVAADVQVLAVRGKGNRLDLGRATHNDRIEPRFELPGCRIDRSEEALRLSLDLREPATDVIAAVRLDDCPHRGGFGCERVLARIDRDGRQRALRSDRLSGGDGNHRYQQG